MQNKKSSSNVLKLIILALLGTISFLLFLFQFPIPPMPPFLKVDFGEVPALIAALIFSPLAGIIVIGIKNFLYLVAGGGSIVGVVANFLSAAMFVTPVAIIYQKRKGLKSIVSGLIAGTVVMAIGMSILNYIAILPIYELFMGIRLEDMGIENLKAAVVFGILPFNIIKGIIVGILFVPLFIKMRSWIEEKQASIV